jgi:predicted Zn-dependent protease
MSIDLAQRALAAAGGDALASVTHERSLMLRFARSRPTQATSVDDLTVEVAAVRDGHVGRAAGNATDADGVAAVGRAAATAAEAAARTAPDHGSFPGFPAVGPPPPHDGHDAATATLDPEPGGRALGAAIAAAGEAGAEAGGIWTAAEVQRAVVSTAGAEASERVTDAFMKVVATGPTGRTGYSAQTAVASGALDPDDLARRAAGKAVVDDPPVSASPGTYPVVFEPPAVAELLWVLARVAFDGLAHAEGRGALEDRIGTRVVSPAVNIADSPRYGSTLPRAFDAEGVPKAALPLIQDGVAHRVVHHTRSAALAGVESTGHARVAADSGRAAATNLVMAGGGAADEDELCAGIERGIYVTRLWYTNILRPANSLFTTVTRDGTFLIENGKVTRPVVDMRVTDSALEILSRTEALGANSVLTSDGELYGRRFAYGTVCPPLRASAVRFTGSSDA